MRKGIILIFLAPWIVMGSLFLVPVLFTVGLVVLSVIIQPAPEQRRLAAPSQYSAALDQTTTPGVSTTRPRELLPPASPHLIHTSSPLASAQGHELRRAIEEAMATVHRASFCGAMGTLGFVAADIRHTGVPTAEMIELLHFVTTGPAMRRDLGAIITTAATLADQSTPAQVQTTMRQRCFTTRAARTAKRLE